MFWVDVSSAFIGAFIGVSTPFLIPKFCDFLLSRSLERFKLRLNQSQKADKISELFAYMPRMLSGWVPAPEDELKLNKLILELSLFLPDDLVCRLSQTLCLPEHRIKYKDCFVEIRKHILGSEDKLIGENIAHVMFCPITPTQPNQKGVN